MVFKVAVNQLELLIFIDNREGKEVRTRGKYPLRLIKFRLAPLQTFLSDSARTKNR